MIRNGMGARAALRRARPKTTGGNREDNQMDWLAGHSRRMRERHTYACSPGGARGFQRGLRELLRAPACCRGGRRLVPMRDQHRSP